MTGMRSSRKYCKYRTLAIFLWSSEISLQFAVKAFDVCAKCLIAHLGQCDRVRLAVLDSIFFWGNELFKFFRSDNNTKGSVGFC